jgi:DNA helicase HerA-like ATPase
MQGSATGKDFIALIQSKLEGWLQEAEDPDLKSANTADKKSIADVLNKLEHMRDKYGNILSLEAKDIIDNLKVGKANILDLGSVDEFASDVVVSHILRNVLASRKEFLRTGDGLEFPIFLILEEAHILAPQNRKPNLNCG